MLIAMVDSEERLSEAGGAKAVTRALNAIYRAPYAPN